MKRRILGLRLDPPMAIARVGAAAAPVEAYRWEIADNAHRGVQTRIVPAPSLRPVPCDGHGDGACRLEAHRPQEIRFKDDAGRIRPVAPFFGLWARVQDGAAGAVEEVPLTPALLRDLGATLADLRFTVTAANRKAEARTKLASCAAIARVDFAGDDYVEHRLDAISPHTEGQVQLVRPDAPLPLGRVQTFVAQADPERPEARLDQVRLRFTPGTGMAFGPAEAAEAPASPLPPGGFEPAISEYGRIHTITPPENRFLSSDTPWLGYSFDADDLPKWPTPMDSYDGARVGSNAGWGVIDDTCDLAIQASLTAQGACFTATARAFTGPPDFAPDRRPFYSIRDELEDRDHPPAALDIDETPAIVLDLFRRIFETSSLLNLDARRAWALSGNAGLLGAVNPDDPDWDAGIEPRLGPRSMRETDAPLAELTPPYTPGQGDTVAPRSGARDPLPYTTVVQQVHARMADSPILKEFLARRPDRVRRIVRPPFAHVAELPRRVGADRAAEVPMAHPPQDGLGKVRYRDPRGVLDQLYDMRMPPYMRHSMGYPLSITRRHYDLLMAYLDRLESDPAWRDDPRENADD